MVVAIVLFHICVFRLRLDLCAVITRRECNAKDNVEGGSKLLTISLLQILFNRLLPNGKLKSIKILRTDTTHDLSQKAEKSWVWASRRYFVIPLNYGFCKTRKRVFV